jgi:hypothetical protein
LVTPSGDYPLAVAVAEAEEQSAELMARAQSMCARDSDAGKADERDASSASAGGVDDAMRAQHLPPYGSGQTAEADKIEAYLRKLDDEMQ